LWLSGSPAILNFSRLRGDERQAALMITGIGNFGPLIAALIVRVFINKEGLTKYLGWRRSWKYYLVALLAPAFYYGLQTVFYHVVGLGRFTPTRTDMPLWAYVGPYLLIISLFITPYVFGEEYGWRGDLLPRLLVLGEIKATVMVGAITGFWHLPLLLVGWVLAGQSPLIVVPLYVVNLIFLAFPYTWLYIASGRSVAVVSLLHGSVDAYGNGLTGSVVFGSGANALIASLFGPVVLGLITLVVYGVFKRSPQVKDMPHS
jgi:hypothetical protein